MSEDSPDLEFELQGHHDPWSLYCVVIGYIIVGGLGIQMLPPWKGSTS